MAVPKRIPEPEPDCQHHVSWLTMNASGDERGAGNKATLHCGECGKTWLNLSGLAVMLRGFCAETTALRRDVEHLKAKAGIAPAK